MKKAFLISLMIGVYVLVNLIAIYHISSYGYMLSVFKYSNHYQMLKHYQDEWNVPVWVGEFLWESQLPNVVNQPYLIPLRLWTSFTDFPYLADQSMVRIIDEDGWSWSYWEYEKVVFTDERLNSIFSKYMKGNWKPTDPTPKLVVKGKEIETEDGRPVLLKGPNLPLKHLAYYSELEVGEGVFQKLDEMGANVVRVVINPECLRPREGEWNQKSFETLKQALDLAEKHHIYVILNLHHYLSSSVFRGGCGFPPWYVQRYSDWQKFEQMWVTRQHPYEDSWDFVMDTWKKIIDVSKGRNIVAGYDLFNEPPGQPRKFYEYLSSQIEPLDPGKIHFAETMYLFRGMDSEDKPKIDNLVLSPHFYDVWKPNFFMVTLVTSTLLLVAVIIFSIVLIAREKMKFSK